jgi:hypothetical protein
MAEKTKPESIAQAVVKRAQQKVLARDAATVLVGMQKAARGTGCGTKSKKKGKKKKYVFPKESALRMAVSLLKLRKNSSRLKQRSKDAELVKAAAGAIVAIKSGTEMQKQAAIAQLLKMLASKGVGGLGKAMSGVGGKLSGKVMPGMLSSGKAPGALAQLGGKVGGKLQRGGSALGALAKRLGQAKQTPDLPGMLSPGAGKSVPSPFGLKAAPAAA